MVGSSIWTYISGVHHHLKIWLLDDFQHSFLIALVLHSVTSPECQRDVRIPITMGMLQSMFHTASHVTGSPCAAVLMKAILTLGFFGLFWPEELTWSPHTIQFWDIKVSPQAAFIILWSAKCQKVGLPCKIKLSSPICNMPCKGTHEIYGFSPPSRWPPFCTSRQQTSNQVGTGQYSWQVVQLPTISQTAH